jgi:hypothetical protein
MKMSLGGPRKNADPAAEASKKGKAPTLGEVQKSLKVRIKQRIISMMELILIICAYDVSILAIDQDTHSSNNTHGDSSEYVIDPSRCFCDLKY